MLRFDGRVVIVTGAGGGLGREYALAFGARGAKVVVNDIMKNDEGYAAEAVANEIRKAGGTAVANLDSVENGEAIAETALSNYGRVDVLVNNAGFLRDRAFANITETEWMEVYRVHCLAVFRLTRLLWSTMREQKYGKLIFVASSAGLFGNFGQSNYSSAKMSVYGMARTLALEGARFNISTNVIAPMAESRLTKTLMREEDCEKLPPADIAPFVLWLAHESCPETGATFYLGGGWCTPVRVLIGRGVQFRNADGQLTLEAVRDRWDEMKKIPTTDEMQSAGHAFSYVMQQIDQSTEHSKLSTFDDIIGLAWQDKFKYSVRDACLYALSVGVSLRDSGNLKFVYENHSEFSPLPTCLVPEALKAAIANLRQVWQQIGANPLRILHGENYFEVLDYASLSKNIDSEFSVRLKFEDVIDKGKGLLVLLRAEILDSDDNCVAKNQFCFFQYGDHGVNLKSTTELQIPLAESSHFSGEPHEVVEERTGVDQAVIYRLTGDLNPVHIDPDAAQIINMPQPIMHGLCTFGYVVRHVLARFANNDASAFKAIKVRFTKPVVAGQTLRTEMWLGPLENGIQRIYLRCRIVETNELCISNSYVDLLSSKPLAIKAKY